MTTKLAKHRSLFLWKAYGATSQSLPVIRFQHIALQGTLQRLDSTLATKVLLKLSLCVPEYHFRAAGQAQKLPKATRTAQGGGISLFLLLALRAGSCSLMQSIPKVRRPMKFVKTSPREREESVLFKLNQDYLYSARIIFMAAVELAGCLPPGAISATKVVKTRTRRERSR